MSESSPSSSRSPSTPKRTKKRPVRSPTPKSFLEALVQYSDDAILTKDLEGIITSWNPGAERLYGYTPEEAVGKPIYLIAPPERHSEIDGFLERLARGERVEHFETDRQHKDGHMLRVSLTLSPLRDEDGNVIGTSAIARDVTSRHLTDELLKTQLDLLELVVQDVPLEEILTGITRRFETYSPSGLLSSILLYDAENQVLRHGAAPSLPDGYNKAIDGVAIGPTVGSCGTAAFHRKPVIVTDIATDPLWADFKDLALEHGLHACWSTPIMTADKSVLGTFALYYREPREPDDHDRLLLTVFNRIAALAIERHRSEELRQRHVHTFEVLNRVNTSLAGELDHDKLVQLVTDAGTELTGAEFGAFFYNVIEEDGGSYMLYALSGVPAEAFSKFPMPRATALFGPTFRGEGVIRLDDVTRDPRFGLSPPYHGMPEGHLPVRSYLAVPVISRSREVLGGLFFGHHQEGVFHPEHEEIAVGIAAQAAIALDNARLFTEAQHQAGELAKANERKSEFLAMLAHELRNPLAAFSNALALIDEAKHNGEVVVEACGILARQSDHMTKLVDDLLDVSRIGRGQIELRRSVEDLRTIIEQAVEGTEPLLAERGQRLSVELPSRPVPVDGDPVRLRQVVTNLLSNAARYSEQNGRVWLTLKGHRRSAELRIRDEGLGIEPEFLPQIFELFARGGAGDRSTAAGLGIGLTLVRQLVELHGGKIEAKSEGAGKGSEFRVRLPLADREIEEVSEPAPAEPESDLERTLRILLVDDHEEAVSALHTLLEIWGHEVRVAHDGPTALRKAAELEPELVLLDIGLPEMDGWEVARRLRRQPATAKAILVALTGYGQRDDRARSREAGFDHHMVKPLNPQKLKQYLREWSSAPRCPAAE